MYALNDSVEVCISKHRTSQIYSNTIFSNHIFSHSMYNSNNMTLSSVASSESGNIQALKRKDVCGEPQGTYSRI